MTKAINGRIPTLNPQLRKFFCELLEACSGRGTLTARWSKEASFRVGSEFVGSLEEGTRRDFPWDI
jgi:hypothetical protein